MTCLIRSSSQKAMTSMYYRQETRRLLSFTVHILLALRTAALSAVQTLSSAADSATMIMSNSGVPATVVFYPQSGHSRQLFEQGAETVHRQGVSPDSLRGSLVKPRRRSLGKLRGSS